MKLKAIIFDVDGTLAETEEAHRHAFNRAFAEAGRAWHWSENDYRELLKVTGGKERIRHFLKSLDEADSDDFIGELHARKNEIYAELVASGQVTLRPGIARLIKEARSRKLATAIATTTSRANLAALLDCHFGPGSIVEFKAVVTGEDVVRKKPDPEVYTHTLRALDVPPEACVAIEDSRNGLLAAASSGIAVLVTPSLYSSHEQFDGAAGVRGDLENPYPPIDVAALDALLCAHQPQALAL
jgi:HAD superfamily hydrolase (TIGR01509 family)